MKLAIAIEKSRSEFSTRTAIQPLPRKINPRQKANAPGQSSYGGAVPKTTQVGVGSVFNSIGTQKTKEGGLFVSPRTMIFRKRS